MKLYTLEITYRTVVSAESEKEARSIVEYGMGDIDDPPEFIQAQEITDLQSLPTGWQPGYIPWGKSPDWKEDATIREIFEHDA
jgi:hypothetical protein